MSSTNQQTGWIFVWIVCLFPIVLWFFAPASVPRFNSIPSTLLSISKLAALVGTSMFALTLFLSARIKIFEKFFNGLNQVYERHLHTNTTHHLDSKPPYRSGARSVRYVII